MNFLLARACSACVVLLAMCGLAYAGADTNSASPSAESRHELTLALAIETALRRNPDLQASSYEIAAAQIGRAHV